jgi:hypothetical protein
VKQEAIRPRLDIYFMLISWLAYSSTLMMEEACSSEMLVDFKWTTQHYIPEDRTLFMISQQWAAVVNSSSCFVLSY